METEATRAEPEISVSIERLTKDLRAYARGMTRAEARYIVNTYYALQKNRIAAFAQAREAANSADERIIVEGKERKREYQRRQDRAG